MREKQGKNLAENLIFWVLQLCLIHQDLSRAGPLQRRKGRDTDGECITGDHKATAVAVAADIGIFVSGDLAVTGAELEQMDEQALERKLEQISVYARVSPEHKIRIVEAWQRKGHITL